MVLGWWDRGRLVGGGVRWEMRRGFGKVNRGGGGGGRRSHGGGKKVSGRWWVSLSSERQKRLEDSRQFYYQNFDYNAHIIFEHSQ